MNLGGHNYFYFNYHNVPLLLTVGDCEYIGARRFIDSTADHNFHSLCTAIGDTIWAPNRYNVQTNRHMDFLLGQNETQEFINTVSERTNFFGLMPEYVCVANIGLYPFHDLHARWEIDIGFGSALEFHQNYNPNAQNNQINLEDNLE